jgi:sphingolipid delta-4 desaturase
MVTFNFIFDPKIGMWSRVRREGKGGVVGGSGGGSGGAGGLKDE